MTEAQEQQPSPIESRVRELLDGKFLELGYTFDELELRVSREQIVEACRLLKEDSELDFKYLRSLSVVDWVEELEAVYHLSSVNHPNRVVIKVRVSNDDPWVPTVIDVWRGADWHEREGHDLFGMEFRGHPNMAPLLLYEGFEGFPGRKNFELPEQVTFYGD